MTTQELFDRMQCSPVDDVVNIGNVLCMALENLKHAEWEIEQLKKTVRAMDKSLLRTSNIASCLANGIQPD